jgi:hypothetical protein
MQREAGELLGSCLGSDSLAAGQTNLAALTRANGLLLCDPTVLEAGTPCLGSTDCGVTCIAVCGQPGCVRPMLLPSSNNVLSSDHSPPTRYPWAIPTRPAYIPRSLQKKILRPRAMLPCVSVCAPSTAHISGRPRGEQHRAGLPWERPPALHVRAWLCWCRQTRTRKACRRSLAVADACPEPRGGGRCAETQEPAVNEQTEAASLASGCQKQREAESLHRPGSVFAV